MVPLHANVLLIGARGWIIEEFIQHSLITLVASYMCGKHVA
jgi:hypothetical protein